MLGKETGAVYVAGTVVAGLVVAKGTTGLGRAGRVEAGFTALRGTVSFQNGDVIAIRVVRSSPPPEQGEETGKAGG